MSSIAEIKHHIKAIDDTAKITRAMYLISSGKMKKAMRAHDQTMKYFNLVRSNMRFILDNSPEGFRSVFYRDHGKRCAFLVIAGDKGMCGGYNQDLLKLAMQKTTHSHTHQRTYLLTFGQMATQFYQKRGIPMDESYPSAVQHPTMDFARELAMEICDQYQRYKFDEVFVIFTQLLRGGTTLPTCLHILPINRSAVIDVAPMHTPLVGLAFEPNQADALDAMV
ncbi:MAG: F0F1 ATP synthase subunit gamma, partial [Clostridia bacterium]|nr:F0F1 ATP synthase subunit gamma [Clostridia bacterium]